VAIYNVGDLRKGLKVQIDNDPYLIIECNFVKPGKGQAMYKLRLKNLVRQTTLDRTYRSGDSLEVADITEISAQFLYRQGSSYVFMDTTTYEQMELTEQQVDDTWQWLKDGMECQMVLFNGSAITLSAPNHVVLRVEYCEPTARGNTATNLQKPVKLETGAEILAPAFVEIGDLLRIDTRTSEYIERVKE